WVRTSPTVGRPFQSDDKKDEQRDEKHLQKVPCLPEKCDIHQDKSRGSDSREHGIGGADPQPPYGFYQQVKAEDQRKDQRSPQHIHLQSSGPDDFQQAGEQEINPCRPRIFIRFFVRRRLLAGLFNNSLVFLKMSVGCFFLPGKDGFDDVQNEVNEENGLPDVADLIGRWVPVDIDAVIQKVLKNVVQIGFTAELRQRLDAEDRGKHTVHGD